MVRSYHAKREIFFLQFTDFRKRSWYVWNSHEPLCESRWVRGSSTPFSSSNGFVYSYYCMSVLILVTIGIFMLLGSVVQKKKKKNNKTNPSTYGDIQLRYSLLCKICPLSFLFFLPFSSCLAPYFSLFLLQQAGERWLPYKIVLSSKNIQVFLSCHAGSQLCCASINNNHRTM